MRAGAILHSDEVERERERERERGERERDGLCAE